MARFLPLFPLGIVVFPGEKLNLHIFEPRYKQLVSECFEQKKTFGIPAFINNAVSSLGTEIKILSIEKTYANGEMDIKTKGMGIIKVVDFFKQAPNKFYPAGTVEDIKTSNREDSLLRAKITESIRQLYSILGINNLFMELPDNYKIFDIAHHIGFSIEQEYEILQCQDESSRQEIVFAHLQRILPVLLKTEKLKDRVRMNGHFKNIVPPNF
ncbi:LON peptidase substrate-binding domain-containing protein [Adhaeribacter aquaticus]|uniref:LON peptidase substrate-binding domain-containing protein n=1 Tax=Adhaeribacter aquaticus TaxID=299567 RepID=UPI0004267F56|nr:LON peptidase substrate-binding domain-containing protein [Adhaeribacter aquaticus]